MRSVFSFVWKDALAIFVSSSRCFFLAVYYHDETTMHVSMCNLLFKQCLLMFYSFEIFNIVFCRILILVQNNEYIFSNFVDWFTFCNWFQRNKSRKIFNDLFSLISIRVKHVYASFLYCIVCRKIYEETWSRFRCWKSALRINGRAITSVRDGAVGIVPNEWFIVFPTLVLDDVFSEYFAETEIERWTEWIEQSCYEKWAGSA